MNEFEKKKNELLYLKLRLVNEYTDYFSYYKSWWMAIYATSFNEFFKYQSKRKVLKKEDKELD